MRNGDHQCCFDNFYVNLVKCERFLVKYLFKTPKTSFVCFDFERKQCCQQYLFFLVKGPTPTGTTTRIVTTTTTSTITTTPTTTAPQAEGMSKKL